MEFVAGLIFLGLVAWQGASYFSLEEQRTRFLASANEYLYNARAAKAKRNGLITQLTSIVREFAAHEAGIIESSSSYTQVIGILGSLPDRYPRIGADRHYFSLLEQASSESSMLQNKIETHNSAASSYNALVTGPSFRWNFFTSAEPIRYLGPRMYENLSSDGKDLEG